MKIYLMQHGEALTGEQDPQRPLSSAGIEQIKTAAQGMRMLGLRFDLIMASPKRRSQQTAALVAERLRYAYSDILTTETLLPKADPAELLALLAGEEDAGSVLLAGHLPHLAALARHLSGGGEVEFDHAGLVCLAGPVEPARIEAVLPHRFLSALTAGKA